MSDIVNVTRTYRFADGIPLVNSQLDSELSNIVDRINKNISYVTANVYKTSIVLSSNALIFQGNGVNWDLTSIALTNGEWDIWATAGMRVIGTDVVTRWGAGLWSVSGDTAFDASASFPNNQVSVIPSITSTPTGNNYNYLNILPFRFNVTPSSQTLYLKLVANYSAGTPTGFGSIVARRVNI